MNRRGSIRHHLEFPEAARHPRYRYFPETGEEKYHSFLGVPLLRGNDVLGAMAVQDYENLNAYNQNSLQILTAFANQAAIAIENARLFENTRYNAAIETLISQISSAFVNIGENQVDRLVPQQLVVVTRLARIAANELVASEQPDVTLP